MSFPGHRGGSDRLIVLALLVLLCGLTGCWTSPSTNPSAGQAVDSTTDGSSTAALVPNEVPVKESRIPTEALSSTLTAHRRGLGLMERYEYAQAAAAFREVRRLAPDWIPGSINLAIALLNMSGTKAEEDKRGGSETPANFDEALMLLSSVIEREPNNVQARYCRGVILEYLGRTADAHVDFEKVVKLDPKDGHAWLRFGETLADSENPAMPAGPKQAKELIEIYTKALECNPYLITAWFKLQASHGWAGQRDKQREAIELWRKLNPQQNAAGPGDTAESFYGEAGKYAKIINEPLVAPAASNEAPPPRFGPPTGLDVPLEPGTRWASSDDLSRLAPELAKIHRRFGSTAVSLDFNQDGLQDLYLASALVGPKGIRDALLINRGQGRFEDVSVRVGLPMEQASAGVAVADFDADRSVDLLLTGVGKVRLFRNVLGRRLLEVTREAGLPEVIPGLALTARWLDLDQDGDLDLYLLTRPLGKEVGSTNLVYRNDGAAPKDWSPAPMNWAPLASMPGEDRSIDLLMEFNPLGLGHPPLKRIGRPLPSGLSLKFTAWPKTESDALIGGVGSHTGIAALDFDDDRDLDLVLSSEEEGLRFVANDRLGRFHQIAQVEGVSRPSSPLNGLLTVDLNQDGLSDLIAVSDSGGVQAWLNTTERTQPAQRLSWADYPSSAKNWTSAVAVDLDLDRLPDLVGHSTSPDASAVFARNERNRLASRALVLQPAEDAPNGGAPGVGGVALGDWVGDALPDLLLLTNGGPPRLARNLGNGQGWLALHLGGRWKVGHDWMRSNPHALGTRVSIESEGLSVALEHTTMSTGLGQSTGAVVVGLGPSESADLVRLRWPDGVMQCELNVSANQLLSVDEKSRKTGSCPVVFTWNGRRFECLGDILGGGGLGYLVAPGVYGQPDRDEAMSIAARQLAEVDGVYRLSIVEPMDEAAYLDQLTLDVVDRPPGYDATPDERFAPEGPRPSGSLLAWKTSIAPAKAWDHLGRDVTETLKSWDRSTVDRFHKLRGWVGYAEDHSIILDFGDRLAAFDSDDQLTLVLAGWVEYPYSQTNYAASTAGVALRAPVIEREQPDGTWRVIEPLPGYPAGLPRRMTVDLKGKLIGPTCRLRITTNMECYWDEAFLAVIDDRPKLRVTCLPVARASLGFKGYLREMSPDGGQPLLYAYDYEDPAPLARMIGTLTRFGEVRDLLTKDDDKLCVVGPGDEVRLEFEAKAVPELPTGWTRSFVLRATGYCKDADPLTNSGDCIGPLPWKGMGGYPFDSGGERPTDASYEAYLREYQTRKVTR